MTKLVIWSFGIAILAIWLRARAREPTGRALLINILFGCGEII